MKHDLVIKNVSDIVREQAERAAALARDLSPPLPSSPPSPSSPSPLRNSPGFTPGSCDLIRAAPYRLMEDIRDLHSMPHSPVNVPGHRIGSDHEFVGRKATQ